MITTLPRRAVIPRTLVLPVFAISALDDRGRNSARLDVLHSAAKALVPCRRIRRDADALETLHRTRAGQRAHLDRVRRHPLQRMFRVPAAMMVIPPPASGRS